MNGEASASNSLAAILGGSPAIVELREKIRRLSSFDTLGNPHVPTTLVVGETGTGKGLVARAIHESGPRARGPFIDVHCAAIPENLLEAELFGFEAGAFTDAKRAKPGLFEAASKGTLFLDEIDSLPLNVQAKFLKAVEEKRVRRLGALNDHAVDVKIIAATQKDLAACVQDGRFRLDLYHRLASVVLAIPPLRERGGDILLLAEHLLSRYAAAHDLPVIALSDSARRWLMDYSWPGNVRELGHLIERIALLPGNKTVDASLLEELRMPRPVSGIAPPPIASAEADSNEAERIRSVLAATGGNVLRAARILRLTRNALRYRMRRYGIERPLLQGETMARGRPVLGDDLGSAAQPAPPDFDHPSPSPITVPSQPPLIGREKELAVLLEALDSAASGAGRAVIASGEAGIGKSCLLRELRAPSEAKGFLWLEGYYDRTSNHPYQPWVQIIRQSGDDREGAALAQSSGLRVGKFAKLTLQWTANVESAPAIQSDPETERLRLFEGLTGFFLQLSRRRPLVLFIDDLQWAPALDFFHYLIRNIARASILLVATCRGDDLHPDKEFGRALLDIQREPNCEIIRLGPLPQSSIEQLISARIGGAVAPALALAIAAKTGGNPFVVEEMLHLLRDEQALVETPAGWDLNAGHPLRLPDSVKIIVRERIERLGESAAELLRLAAVIGRQFTQKFLETLYADNDGKLADALDRAEDAGIVILASAGGGDTYKFSHDLIQESLYESIGAAQRRRYHLQIGRALETARGGDGRACEALAHHFLAGNDSDKALTYSLEAGESAERAFSWARAAAHFETALALVEKQSDNAAARAQLHEKLADLASLLGRANLEHSHKALALYTALGDLPKACRMERLIGVAWTSGTAGKVDLERALGHFEKASEIIEPEPDSMEKALAHGYLAFGLLRARLDLPRAKSEADNALAMAEQAGDADVLTRLYTELGVAQAYLGDLSAAEEAAEKSWQVAEHARDPWMGARAALYPITFWPWRNERNWLELWTSRCLKYRETARVTRYDAAIFSLQALLMALSGQPEQAKQALTHAEEAISQRSYFTPYWLHFTAAAWSILGDEEKSIALFDEALTASRAGRLLSNTPEVVLQARFLLDRGDTGKAGEILAEGYQVAKEHDSRVQELTLLPLLVEVKINKGDLNEAETLLAEAENLQTALRAWHGQEGSVLRARALLAEARSKWNIAEESFSSALERERRHGFLFGEAGILLQWAELHGRRQGDGAKARELRSRALAIYERCGAAAAIERMRRLAEQTS